MGVSDEDVGRDEVSLETSEYQSSPEEETARFTTGAKIGRYTVEREIGRGGFGTVYLAQDPQLQRQVAIKVPRRRCFTSDDNLTDFIREARTVANLKHTCIVPVFDVGQLDDGTAFVVMEYVDGPTLSELIASEQLPHQRAVELVIQIADALSYAHQQGFVHRDLKPGNVLLNAEGKASIVDFGLAVHESFQRQLPRQSAGTLAYMAPEQVQGDVGSLDGRADIWSLGVILYELLGGRRPFQGKDRAELADEIFQRDPKPLQQIDPTISAELEDVCRKCLAKKISDRYTNATAVANDLRLCLAGENPSSAIQPALPSAATGWSKARPLTTTQSASLAAAAVAIAIVLFLVFRPPPDPTPSPAQVTGNISVLTWDPQNQHRRGINLNDPGALPLHKGDQIRIEVQLNRPAYVYLIWIDGQGEVIPVYPWLPGNWNHQPKGLSPTQYVSLPEAVDEGWPMGGPPGMETLMLLVRSTPLPKGVVLAERLTDLKVQPMQHDEALVWFAQGKPIAREVDRDRGPQFFDPENIDDPVLTNQRIIQQRLGPHFDLIRAVSFANRGE